MSNFTTELIKNLSNNVSVEEIFRSELEKAFNQLLETELDCFLGYEKYSKDGYNTGDSRNGYYKRTFQTKYGERGISTMRAHTFYAPPSILEYMPQANARTKVFAQAETAAGVENIEEILQVKGVDGVLIGPNDLSADCGCLGNDEASAVLSAIERVGSAAKKQGKLSGIITGNKNYIAKAKACGLEMFCKGSELNAIAEYCKKVAKEFQ